MYNRVPKELDVDILVMGAGLAGVCAAISAARLGCSVVILEKFRTLGGNSGPEVGVHPSGAHRFHPYAAETGIIEEIVEEAAKRGAKTLSFDKHYNISQMWDGVLYDKLREAGVTVLRCNYAKEPVMNKNRIESVMVEDIVTYETRKINVKCAVIDSTGDGNVSALAGAQYFSGREGKETYGERSATEADDITLGSSLVAYIRQSKGEVEFAPPPNTPEYFEGYDHYISNFPESAEGFFIYPTETGGESGVDTILDDHAIYDKLLDQLYSTWDHIKNEGDGAKNWELVWVSPRVARRESRRFAGDYVLNQNDVENGVVFDDAVAFGGFPEDLHYPREEKPDYIKVRYVAIPPLYSIPYRSLYSKDVDNLFFASRLVSVSHLAHGTVRLQRTLASIGQAAGTAASLCKKYSCTPRDIYKNHLSELLQLLLKNDGCAIGTKNLDENDKARFARVYADSEKTFGVSSFDELVPLDKTRGIMLWDWGKELDTLSVYVKNTSDKDVVLKGTLKHYVPSRKYKLEEEKHKKFSYYKKANQAEWGVDDTRKLFVPEKESDCVVRGGFEGFVTFKTGAKLSEKDMYNDDERYLFEFERNDALLLGLSNAACDFARRADVADGEENYTTYLDSYAFSVSPAPKYGEAENVINGIPRRWSTNPVNMWIAKENTAQSIYFEWDTAQEISQIRITFDTLARAFTQMPFDCGKQISDIVVSDYEVYAYLDGKREKIYEKSGNYNRVNILDFEKVSAEKIEIRVNKCSGENVTARIYEVRIY